MCGGITSAFLAGGDASHAVFGALSAAATLYAAIRLTATPDVAIKRSVAAGLYCRATRVTCLTLFAASNARRPLHNAL